MKNIKQITVETTDTEVTFSKITDFLIINRSDNDITFNLDEEAIIDDVNCGIVESSSVRQVNERGTTLHLIASEESSIEIQAIGPNIVVVDKTRLAGEN